MNWARFDRRAFAFLVLVLVLLSAAGLYRAVAVLFLHVPLDPNEGWNAYLAEAAVNGGQLYPGPSQFLVNNYPPLSFFFVGGLGRVLGDNIFAGRLVSLASFFVMVGFIVAIARRMGATRWAAIFAGAFLSSVLLLESDYVGMDDPQLLGHALELAGLFILLGEPRAPLQTIGVALLFVVALFVKHTLFVLPLAATVWLAAEDRRAAFVLTASAAALVLAGLVVFRLTFGSGLIAHLLTPRTWSSSAAEAGLAQATWWCAAPLAALGLALRLERWNRYVLFCALYVGLALPLGLFLMGGAGVDTNALFDAAIALSLSAALFLQAAVSHRQAAVSVSVFALVLPLGFVLFRSIDREWYQWDFWTHPYFDESRTSEADIQYLRASSGPALCETLALCYWAGKPDGFDLFNLSEAYAAGRLSSRPLGEAIEERRFHVIEFESPRPDALPRQITGSLDRNYVVGRVSDEGYFFVPRRPFMLRAP
jgi:dolichyl-phosphate-mannose-protein mannosyltransferase